MHTLLTVSKVMKEALAQNGIPDVQVLYNGIDANDWRATKASQQDFIRKNNVEGKKMILFGGRISGAKGGDAMLAALPEIIAKVPEAVFVIMGTVNEYVQKLQKNAEEAGMAGHIRYTGWISGEELVAANHAARVIVAPSVYLEPLSMVVIEAMACAKPVVGSCFGGIAEVIEDTVTGYTAHPLATKEFAGRIIEILQNDDLAAEFGAAGAKRQKEVFSEDIQIQKLLTYYTHGT